jgi:hypothetical protein
VKIPSTNLAEFVRDLDRRAPLQEVVLELVEVVPRAEGVASPPQHHHADIRVGVGAADGIAELLHQLGAHAVALLGPVQPDVGDIIVHLVLDDVGFQSPRHGDLPII